MKRYAPPATYEFADGDAMLAAVLAGCGFAQLPLWMVGKYLKSGELKEVLQEYSGIEIPISALWAAKPPITTQNTLCRRYFG
ncbi:LysR substrate binding domain-containing protein [Xenorhabdus japonica]|uniref:LysR substrate binding domain-containing protein n=1 Tax=Xenorhabdus japonica TaxID=53341 RepID=A0A1I5DEE3_9GAMM|nr:LysR substrate binding domain-containing protein [Xenorhabdus japonica]